MTETASLIIKVDSSGARKAVSDLDRLERQSGATERASHKLGAAIGKALGGLASGYAVQQAVSGYIRLSDTWANMSARLGLVTKSAGEFQAAQAGIMRIAQASRTDLEGVSGLYVKLAQSSEALRGNQSLLLGTTEAVSKALTLSGADAASTSAVIRQFSQAMASGTLRGDEFVSVMEGAPRLAKAMADGLGVPIGALREMAAQGELTADRVVSAIQSQGSVIDSEFSKMPITVSGATQKVRNSLMELVGDTDTATGATKDLAGSIDDLATALQSPEVKQGFADAVSGIAGITQAVAEGIGPLSQFLQQVDDFGNRALSVLAGLQKQGQGLFAAAASQGWGRYQEGALQVSQALGEVPGYQPPGAAKRAERAAKKSGEQIAASFMSGLSGPLNLKAGGFNLTAGLEAQARASLPAAPSWLVGDSTKGRPSGGGGGGGRTATGLRERAAATRELSAADKAHADMMEDVAAHDAIASEAARDYVNTLLDRASANEQAMRDGQAATDSLISDMQFELSLMGQSNAERERSIALRQADASATAEQREIVAKLATDIAQAREAEAVTEDIKSATEDFAVSAVTNWKRAGDAASDYADRLKQIAVRMLAEKAVQWLVGLFVGSGTQGGATDLYSSGSFGYFAKGGAFNGGAVQPFAKGGAFTNGVYTQTTPFRFGSGGQFGVMGEAGPEAVMPLERGSDGKLGVRSSGGGSSSVSVNINQSFSVQSRGGDAGTGQTDAFAKKMKAEMEATAKRVINEEQRQGGSLWRMAHA